VKRLRWSYLSWVLLTSLCLVALSVFTAISLLGQHRTISRVLRENVRSQRTAVELEECLLDLIDLENDRVEQVSVLHNRVEKLLLELRELADQPDEQTLYQTLSRSFADYLRRWQTMPPRTDPTHDDIRKSITKYLESDVLKPCQDFEHYNTERVEQSALHHERVLRQLAWGLASVGLLGGTAGIVLGFGIARSVSNSIRRLQVSVRDAAGKLGPHIPEIVLTEDGNLGQLYADIDQLSERIEAVVRDLQQREYEILRAEQLAAVGQLAAGMAHEIRNPLTSIKMLVQAGQETNDAMTTEDLRIIEAEIRRMERSLNTFLEFARPPKLARQAVLLKPLIDDIVGLIRLRAEKQQVVVSTMVSEEARVWADAGQLRQVLLNLSLNALDMMPNGGQLEILVRQIANEWEIEILDSGPGISKEMLPKLFEPFVSTKDTGLGLGLVVSKRIVEAHDGRMNAANRVGGGASFFMRLPQELPRAECVAD
jgi:two-component system, NtrC family, sensor histidine kinase HydH